MNRTPARVTVGLPVYNGAALVHRAIDATLNQTFSDLELLISDNCSSDATEEICREYARRDPRVVYTKTERNLGAAGNYSRLARMARGEFFKWLSHDDSMAPDFIEKCLPYAESNPEIVTVMPTVDVVDQNGVVTQTITSYVGRSQWSRNRLEQYRQMMTELAYCETHGDGLMMILTQYGLHRSELLRRTRLIMPFISSDCVLSAELALFGQLQQIEETRSQFTLSTSPASTTANFAAWDPMAIQRMLSPATANRLGLFVSARRRHVEHVAAVLRSPLSAADKVLALEAATRPTRARFEARITGKWGQPTTRSNGTNAHPS
jgi:hypothetical protein